ncbi:MAG: sulfotransferase family protein [Alphaproteobacteria bacterium]|jgi:hypothetical protein|nr:sulfotransferase family protein [Alphaproteobacteria bacterium]
MGLKVIGAGYGRTGTLSMKAALEQLGYTKCHHMTEVFASPGQVGHWLAIARGETPDWDEVFEGYQAAVDFPACIFWRELAEAYPDAKLILTERPAEKWYDSAYNTIYALTKAVPGWMKTLLPRMRRIDEFVNKLVWRDVFDGRFEDKAHAIDIYERHVAAVKAALPPERLLVMEISEGWQPLCEFLGHEVPDWDFPRVNDTAEFRKGVTVLKRLAWVPWIVGALLLTAVAIALAT